MRRGTMNNSAERCSTCGHKTEHNLYVSDGEGRRIKIETEGYADRAAAMKAAATAARGDGRT